VIVLVPAYQPDERLVGLVRALTARETPVLVVDDGSGPAFAGVFARARAAGAALVVHPVNRGKGAALRTGFAWALEHRPGEDVVAADCDGQHAPDDVLAVAERLAEGEGPRVVLGVRRFTGRVPLRSRFGNAATRAVFRLASGRTVPDTQTGLRGYSASLLAHLLTIRGDRFEYEMNVLLDAVARSLPVDEVPIATVYLDDNASSHFRPVRDSVRVLAPLAAFAGSSLLAFVVDTVVLLAVQGLTGRLLVAVLAARAVSATVNFTVNRIVVFPGRSGGLGRAATGYGTLALVLLAAGFGLLTALTGLGLPLLPAKVLTDGLLFWAGFRLQDSAVFARAPLADVPSPTTSAGRQVVPTA
jgi:putative flippase GtrA